jgi:hypothetical protein
MFSMKSATATISGIRRSRVMNADPLRQSMDLATCAFH